jgi:hypothetical protein
MNNAQQTTYQKLVEMGIPKQKAAAVVTSKQANATL